MADYWLCISGKSNKGNMDAMWLKLEKHRVLSAFDMKAIIITASDISRVCRGQ